MKNKIQARKNYSGVSCKFVGFLHGESVPVFKLKNNYLPITDEFQGWGKPMFFPVTSRYENMIIVPQRKKI